MEQELGKGDHKPMPNPSVDTPLVGAPRRGRKAPVLRITVAQRRQTAEERRQYQAAVRALVAELISKHLDRMEE